MLRFACKMVACDSAADLLAEYGYVESGLGPGSTVKLFRVLAPRHLVTVNVALDLAMICLPPTWEGRGLSRAPVVRKQTSLPNLCLSWSPRRLEPPLIRVRL